MGRPKKGTKENPVTLSDLKRVSEIILGEDDRPFLIKEAAIKDDFCNYRYEITKGVGLDDTHKVDGKGIIKDDMRDAFSQLNVHLACIDEVFKHSGVEVEDINKMRSDELTFLYHVTGFKIKGGKDDESIILLGHKYLSSAGGRMELETPKISLDNASSYKWYNELKTAADQARREVELYKEGKYTPVEVEEEEDANQIKMFDNAAEETEKQEVVEETELDEDFANAAL
jgi:hypothetical protein